MTSDGGPAERALRAALADSRRLGMLGAAPISVVVAHAEAFVAALEGVEGCVVDLGTGGGVPGLVIAARRPDLAVVLVDRRTARTDHLHRLVGRLGWSDRVRVVTADAVALPRMLDPAAAVVARSFGPPLVTLRVAVASTAPRGRIVISEPPVPVVDRWPDTELDVLGVVRRPHADPRVAVFVRRST